MATCHMALQWAALAWHRSEVILPKGVLPMQFNFNTFQTPLTMVLVLLFSGIPLPLIDSHPTSLDGIGDNVHLREHLVVTPSEEHRDVGDAELHIHWIYPLIEKDSERSHLKDEPRPQMQRSYCHFSDFNCTTCASFADFHSLSFSSRSLHSSHQDILSKALCNRFLTARLLI